MKKTEAINIRKKYRSLMIPLILVCLLLTGCGAGKNQETDPSRKETLQVMTTIFPAYDFARQVGGDRVTVKMLLSPGEEVHSYEPAPKDIIAIEQSDIFIYVGGESDAWVEDILESIDTSDMTIISMMEVTDILTEEMTEGMQEERHWDGIWSWLTDRQAADGHDHELDDFGAEDSQEYDEHVWTSPVNAAAIVQKIADEFCRMDPAGESLYRELAASYLSALENLAKELLEIREQAVRTTIIVGDRFPFRYLTEFMNLDYYAAFPGCAGETEPSAKTVAFLIDKVKAEEIPVVFYMEFSSHMMAERIGEETGAAPLLLHSCHNVTKEEFEAGITYLDIMEQNAANLKEALN